MQQANISYHKQILEQIEESTKLKESLKEQAETITTIAREIAQAFRRGNKVLLFGNGGSAADAQHIAAELAGSLYFERAPLPAIALTTNTSALTAIANDYSYETVFARQVRGLASKGDIVIGISTSGKSRNVVLGLEEARYKKATTVAFTGEGGKLKDVADYTLSVSSKDTPRIQEVHILAGHIICYLIGQVLFGEAAGGNNKAGE